MAAEQGGLIGALKGLFERMLRPQGERRAARRIERRQREQREEVREKADIIKDELDRITPQHPAYELLNGINLDANALANDDFANEIINILHTPDPNNLHDPAWLLRTKDRLRNFAASAPVQELIDNRIDPLINKAADNRDRREAEKQVEQREWLPPEQIRAERQKVEELGGPPANQEFQEPAGENASWQALIAQANLPAEYKQDVTAIGEGDMGNRDRNHVVELSRAFMSEHKRLIKELSRSTGENMRQQQQNLQDQLDRLDRAWRKTARHIVEKTGSEKGRLFEALRGSQAEFVEKQIQTDANYRDFWFYNIISPILYNQQSEGHRELYNLYVAGDMDSFLEIVRRIKDKDGNKIGLKLAARYDILRNTIFQSHDMDLYAAHPTQDMKEFIGSTGLFVNKYIDAASQDPMVALAKRAYEIALLQIRDTNGGYIPREWLTWEEGKMRATKLDEVANTILRQAIEAGQLYHVKTDDVVGTGLPHPSVWNRKQIDPTRPFTMSEIYGYESKLSDEYRRNLGDLKIAAALKQAKALGLIDMRFLEIIGQSKGTGSEYDQAGEPDQSFSLAAKQFNSVPYEGIVRHLYPITHYYSRFRMGGEYYDAFFNMLVTGQWKGWDPEIMKHVVALHWQGKHEEMLDYLKKKGFKNAAEMINNRLVALENPFQFSGMWGPFTKWRFGDASISFDDWERERAYGTNIKLIAADQWAEREARRRFESRDPLYRRLRHEYRSRLLESNNAFYRQSAENDQTREADGLVDDNFEALWRKAGKDLKAFDSTQTYRKILDDRWHEAKKKGDYKALISKLEKAYKARTWVQAAMRAPLLVARHVDKKWNLHGGQVKGPLRREIIWKILGIDTDDIAAQRTPLSKEEAGFDRIVELESALAALQQTATRENRDLTERDFARQIDLIRRDAALTEAQKSAKITNWQNALTYWNEVKKAMFGRFGADGAADLYREFGIGEAPGDEERRGNRMHTIDWDQVNRIVEEISDKKGPKYKLKFETGALTNTLLDENYRTLFSTEDMGWEYLNIGALGERNPVRRAGDLASHAQFGQEFEKFLTENIVARPKVEDLVKQMKIMWEALAGDHIEVAIPALYKIAYTTGMLYKKADISWNIPFVSPIISIFKDSSIMQMIRGRDRADAWGPNDLLHYVQAVGGQQILPKRRWHGLAGVAKVQPGYFDQAFQEVSSGHLGKALGGTKNNATWEIINMTLMIATLITLWRAFTAKSEEEQ